MSRPYNIRHVDLAKAKYYKEYFEEHKYNSRKQWEMIYTILNRYKKVEY